MENLISLISSSTQIMSEKCSELRNISITIPKYIALAQAKTCTMVNLKFIQALHARRRAAGRGGRRLEIPKANGNVLLIDQASAFKECSPGNDNNASTKVIYFS